MEYITTPHQAELNAAEVMKSWGYLDAVATTGGADGGIDVRSRDALAQVKWKNGMAGRPDLQRLVGARGLGTQQLFFFAASNYTKGAVEYANQVGMSLLIYDPTGKTTPINRSFIPTTTTPMTRRSWTSNDYMALLHVLKRVVAILGVQPTNRSSKRKPYRRRA